MFHCWCRSWWFREVKWRALGFGLIGNGVGAIAGFILGAMGGVAGAVALGWDKSIDILLEFVDKGLDGTFAPWLN